MPSKEKKKAKKSAKPASKEEAAESTKNADPTTTAPVSPGADDAENSLWDTVSSKVSPLNGYPVRSLTLPSN